MEFAFTAEQIERRDALREFLARECPPSVVRGAWEGKLTDLWPRLADMGVVGLTAPSDVGGMAMDELDLVLLLEEAGRAALPEPLLETTAVAVPLLAATGGAAADEWLEPAAAGDVVISVALGETPLLPFADRAQCFVVEDDLDAYLVERDGADLASRPSVDATRSLAWIDWDQATATKLEAVDLAPFFDRGALGTAAILVGLADRMLEMTTGYAKERRQFGRPIGSFQAVQHQLADGLLRLEFTRPAVYRAAYAVARDEPDRAVRVSMAKAYANDTAHLVGRTALQVHGAIGYSWEYDLHLFMKRAWALAATWGDAAWHRRRIAAHVLEGDMA